MKEVTKNPIKGTLRLKNPILINGNEITEVTYDSNEIDGILFATAESRRKAAAGRKDISIAPAAEFDFSLHLYLGFAAIVAVNPSYDFSDLERIKGHDVVEVMTIGRNFMLASGEKTQTGDLEKKRVTDFIVEYAEAAEDLAEERKRMEKNRPHFKPKHVRKRR